VSPPTQPEEVVSVLTKDDPIERAKSHAEQMDPEAEIRTKSVKGRPMVLAIEPSDEGGDLIRLGG